MGRVIVSEFVSLDGVIDAPFGWTSEIARGPEGDAFKYEELMAADALLLGRTTYEEFAAVWPTMPGTGDYGEKMNAMPKYVVSSSLTETDWNASMVRDPQDVGGLDGTLLVFGSATLAQALFAAGLVDELRLMLYPVALGEGKRLFASRTSLRLAGATPIGDGIVLLTYQRAAA